MKYKALLLSALAISVGGPQVLAQSTQATQFSSVQINDSDGDGYPDDEDTFPNDPNEWLDTDGDGIGNNADEDDDNDEIPDIVEIEVGMDPLAWWDADNDLDGDNFSNIFEYFAGSGIGDSSVTPKDSGFYSDLNDRETDILRNAYGDYGHTTASEKSTTNIRLNSQLEAGYIILKYDKDNYLRNVYPPPVSVEVKVDGEPIEILSSEIRALDGYEYFHGLAVPASDSLSDIEITLAFTEHDSESYLLLNEVFIPVSDLGADSDGDGYVDQFDQFPEDETEWFDFDRDGIGNNADPDDDNDVVPDTLEVMVGSDPFDDRDSAWDFDRDTFGNWYEYLSGSDATDGDVTPADVGVYSSFEDAETDLIFNTSDYELNDYWDSFGDYVLDAGEGANFSIRGTGRFTSGHILLSTHAYSRYNSWDTPETIVELKINGELVASSLNATIFTHGEFHNTFWNTWAIPVEATRRSVDFELIISMAGDAYGVDLYLDRLFVPMTDDQGVEYFVESDFNGDGIADFASRDNSQNVGEFLIAENGTQRSDTFATKAEDIPLSGDFDGDGIADLAVRRPSNTIFYVKNSSGTNYNSEQGDGVQRVQFGLSKEDVPVTGDFDGDGITDFAVRRPSTGMWYIKNSSGSNYGSVKRDGIQRVSFGKYAHDIPVPADYDGDGITDVAVRRTDNFTWYIRLSESETIRRVVFGKHKGDIPIPADYDGDGKADLAVRRPSNHHWYILRSTDGNIDRIHLGMQNTDMPIISDYDGDGKADVAFSRNSNNIWYVLQSSNEELIRYQFDEAANHLPVMAPLWQKLIHNGWRNYFLKDFRLARPASSFKPDLNSEKVRLRIDSIEGTAEKGE